MSDDDVYWIERPEQFECLMSARRMEIVDQLANVGVCSVREIAAILGAKPSSLYHHIERLLEAHLIEPAGERVINRRVEKLYRTPGAKMRYGIALDDPAAFDIYRRLGEHQSRQTARDFARGLRAPNMVAKGPAKNIWLFRLVGAPDDAALAQINHHIEEIAKLFWSSAGADNPMIVMSAIVAPVPGDGGEAEKT